MRHKDERRKRQGQKESASKRDRHKEEKARRDRQRYSNVAHLALTRRPWHTLR